MATDTTATNNGDNFLDTVSPNTSWGSSATYLYIQRSVGTPYIDRLVMDWTLPSGTGTISSIKLFLYHDANGNDAGGNAVEVHELTRSFGETTSTWNKYDGTNNWTTAGGDFSSTVVDSSNTPAASNWQSWDLGPGATNPISGITWGSNIKLLIKYATENGGGSYEWCNYAPRTYSDTSKRPYIEITYEAAASFEPAVAALSLVGAAPGIINPVLANPSVASLALVSFAPKIIRFRLVTSYRASTSFVISPENVAPSVTFVAGVESDVYDNTTNNDDDVLVAGKWTSAATGYSVGQLRVYVGAVRDDTPSYPNVFDGSASAETVTSVNIGAGFLRLAAVVMLDGNAARTYSIGPFSVAQLFGGVLPPKFFLFITHSSGSTSNATAGNHEWKATGVSYALQ